MRIWLSGLLIGLAYVAPIGAQNMFVINAAMTLPRRRAYMTAAVTVFFDIMLAMACYFGAGALISASPVIVKAMLLVGSLVVIWIGVSLIRSKAALDTEAKAQELGFFKTASRAFVVTWLNPQALIDGTMLLGATRASLGAGEGVYFLLGTSYASALWFFGITTVISLFSSVMSDKVLRVLNIICGCVMIFYGLKLLYSFIAPFFS